MATGMIPIPIHNCNYVDETTVTNIDDEERPFLYIRTSDCTGTIPENTNGYLFTYSRMNSTKMQFFVSASSSAAYKLYMRRKWSNAWSAWKSITFS